MSWIKRATVNLLNLSQSNTFVAAMAEWRMTNQYEDLGEPVGTCELCEHPEIRHTFEIRNLISYTTLWIGSKCIDKFVPLYENGIEITDPIAKTHAVSQVTGRLIDEARRQR